VHPPAEPPVTLTLPADPRSIRLIRTITTAVAGQLEVPLDAVEELRIAVAEACNRLLSSSDGATMLRLRLWPADELLTIAVSLDSRIDPWPVEEDDSLPWRVIQELADESTQGFIDEEPAILMVRRTLLHPAR
jgi:hypothetical protein